MLARSFLFSLVTLLLAPTASAQIFDGPDVVYFDCFEVFNWGSVDGVRGYSLESYTCNMGDQDLAWGDTSPLLAMHLYRLADGRLEQIGLSWVKNATFAVANQGCGPPCLGAGGATLGAGCLDIYSANFNGTHSILGPRSDVNPFTGDYPGASGGGGDAIYKRLQVDEADLADAKAQYFIEGQFVAFDDAASDNDLNNASYKAVDVVGSSFALVPFGETAVGSPAIYAWAQHGLGPGKPDPDVVVVEVDVPDEGRFHVAAKVTAVGGGVWRYEYAVRNLNSHRSAGAFSVPVPGPAVSAASGVGFHDVDYHSGEPYDNTDWSAVEGASSMTWSSPESFDTNPDTNALRWGTMYNFWFDVASAPTDGAATIGLFRPGKPESVTAAVPVPRPCPGDLDGDDDVDQSDLGILLAAYARDAGGDLDGDGDTDQSDLGILLASYGCGVK